MSFHIARDAKFTSLISDRGLSIPVVEKDTNYDKSRLIFSKADGVMSYTNGTQWIDVASGADITQLTIDVNQLTTNVNSISQDSNIVLTAPDVNFTNGKVISAGSDISVTSGPGTTTIGFNPTSTSATVNYLPAGATGKTLSVNWNFLKFGNAVIATINTASSSGTANIPFAAYDSIPGDDIPVSMRPSSNRSMPVLINTGGSATAPELGQIVVYSTGSTSFRPCEPGNVWPVTADDVTYANGFTWFTS
jgi:hypothetical protein